MGDKDKVHTKKKIPCLSYYGLYLYKGYGIHGQREEEGGRGLKNSRIR